MTTSSEQSSSSGGGGGTTIVTSTGKPIKHKSKSNAKPNPLPNQPVYENPVPEVTSTNSGGGALLYNAAGQPIQTDNYDPANHKELIHRKCKNCKNMLNKVCLILANQRNQ